MGRTPRPSRSDGLVLRVGVSTTGPAEALATATRVVAEELTGEWVVRPVGRTSRDFTVRRPNGTPNPTVRQAFDLCYQLRGHRDVEDSEPALVVSLEGPRELQPRRAALRASGPAGTDLTCSGSPTWIHRFCSIEAAWNLPLPTGGMAQGEGILVGHPDTGYSDHPQLNEPGRLLVAQGFDFEDDDADARDDFSGFFPGHGTSTGSVIMSGMDSTASIVGVAPRCKLIPLRVTTSVVLTSFSKLAEAIRFAADQGHHVLSISLGGPFWSRYLSRAVDYALERGVIIVSAAGNVWPFVVYPARLDGVIAAAACNCARSVWPDSATGPAVDITAPGQSVWRALAERSGFSTGRSSGTSFATAIVAGTAALWLAHHNRDHLLGRYGARGIPRVFKELLLSHGFDRPPGWDTTNLGPGILNAARLLSAPLPLTAPANALRTLRAVPGPRSRNQIDEILELFPGEDSARVRRGLARFLDVADRELNTALRDVADEIAYLAVTDLDFRSQLRSGGAPRRARRAPSAAPKRVRATRPVMPPMSTHLKRLVTP